MVKTLAGLLQRITGAVSSDLQRFSAQMYALRADRRSQPGLFTYRISNPEGSLRLHLRIHADQTGLLLVNAQEAIHLTPTAAQMAKLALDDASPEQALATLRLTYPEVPAERLSEDFVRVADTVATLRRPTTSCPVGQISAEQAPLFSVRAQAPYKVDLALHYACNNNCAHCYNEPGRRTMPSLPTEDWKRVLRKLLDIGVPYIIFTGGEPTLHPAIFELIQYAEAQGQITGMNTNGRRLAEPDFAVRLKAAGLDHVQVTLNSHRAALHNEIVGADAFDQTIRGIQRALEAGLHTITNTTLVEANVDEALEIVDFLCGLGVRTFAMNGMIYSGCGACYPGSLSEDELRPVLAAVRERAVEYGMRFLWYTPTQYCRLSPLELGLGPRSCNAGEYSICIEPNGDVLPCQSYYEPAGNILRDAWEEIWDSDLLRSFRYRRENPQAAGLPEQCWECEQLSVCGGGCPLERQARPSEVKRH